MGMTPRHFDKRELKNNYRRLSRINHPDKNPDPNAVEMFRQLTLANEILQSSEKKIAYDIFSQTDFTAEERIIDQLRANFKDEAQRAEQFRLYQTSVKSISLMIDVVPAYITWAVLTLIFLKDDVTLTLSEYYRGKKQSQYYFWFQLEWVDLKEQLDLTMVRLNILKYSSHLCQRFQKPLRWIVVLLLDYTLDRVDPFAQKEDKDQVYTNILKRQQKIIQIVEEFKEKEDKTMDDFKDIYSELLSMASKEGNDFIPAVQELAEEGEQFSAVKFVRLIFGVLMIVSLGQMLLFGSSPSEPPKQ
ncbi:molecular chaperone [Stylonychia lemnae]|uniref:Molecular chaperone n=1 Tax=Stylonychia lemnae TaxID=5949 RepID=A0A078B690_STYLE|nr:molecular chaperone [Stylonychia lemnae]|eukprot:CDW89058.1 molecular chaperone [Stylonychia lemnae]